MECTVTGCGQRFAGFEACQRHVVKEHRSRSGNHRCGARRRSDGRPCPKWCLKGRKRCNNHGGASPRGAASPLLRHGRYSSLLPDQLAALYNRAREDRDLLKLQEEVALADMRIQDLCQKIDNSGAHAIVDRLVRTWLTFQRNRGNPTAEKRYLAEIGDLIDVLGNERSVWRELGTWMDRKVRYVEAERKRQFNERLMISSEELMTLMAGVVSVVKEATALANLQQAVQQGDPQIVWQSIAEGLRPLLPGTIDARAVEESTNGGF